METKLFSSLPRVPAGQLMGLAFWRDSGPQLSHYWLLLMRLYPVGYKWLWHAPGVVNLNALNP